MAGKSWLTISQAADELLRRSRSAVANVGSATDEAIPPTDESPDLAAPSIPDGLVLDTTPPRLSFAAPTTLSFGGLLQGVPQMLDRISMGEGTSDAQAQQHGFVTGYDVPLAFGRFGMPSRPLSQMTLGEVKEYQRQILSRPTNSLNSSAVGKYQIVGRTLRGLQRAMGLDDSVVFSPEIQDRMAQEILIGSGLHAYQRGRITPAQFQENIAHQWASVAHPSTGQATQRLGTTTQQLQPVMAGLRVR